MRKALNQVMNCGCVYIAHVFIPGNPRFPGSQDCYLTLETPLIACKTVPGAALKNASLLRVHSLRPTIVLQDIKSEELIEVTAEQFPQWVRMAHAITYHNSQSKTLPGTVGLFETQSRYFTERHLLVGSSRATQCSDVMIYN